MEKKQISLNQVTQTGLVGKEPVTVYNAMGVSAFTLECDNSAGMAATNYRLFDADGIVAAINGGTFSAASSGTITPAAINSSTVSAPIIISGFNYQTSSSASQFAQSFNFYKGNIDGRVISLPNVIAKAKRNTQFQSLLLTIDEHIEIDSRTALELTVVAGEVVTLTFFVEGFKK